ncbi:hemerythrin domain-containing protein [Ramlibacter albus]|uniref:Hemerythrin domain-containing protein n=1 Tax=Ramlibacter albus TaxID=2079448 RepID=A0A923S4H9_9BURK|nr:hemerythrin domain-containing protein [Ramlibacter albus]MBC5764152.1 hemerythrin domain-containing protein [Ramlibacter albus]
MPQQQDATDLLDHDHNEVMRMFQQYKAAHTDNERRPLASRICHELLVHMQVEEEIFYPAFKRAVNDQEVLQDSQKEHDEAREMIAKIQATPTDAKLMLDLEDAILHHVNDEREKMFPKARKAQGMNLMQLGEEIQVRKEALNAVQHA